MKLAGKYSEASTKSVILAKMLLATEAVKGKLLNQTPGIRAVKSFGMPPWEAGLLGSQTLSSI